MSLEFRSQESADPLGLLTDQRWDDHPLNRDREVAIFCPFEGLDQFTRPSWLHWVISRNHSISVNTMEILTLFPANLQGTGPSQSTAIQQGWDGGEGECTPLDCCNIDFNPKNLPLESHVQRPTVSSKWQRSMWITSKLAQGISIGSWRGLRVTCLVDPVHLRVHGITWWLLYTPHVMDWLTDCTGLTNPEVSWVELKIASSGHDHKNTKSVRGHDGGIRNESWGVCKMETLGTCLSISTRKRQKSRIYRHQANRRDLLFVCQKDESTKVSVNKTHIKKSSLQID